jgi:hypothetical protein
LAQKQNEEDEGLRYSVILSEPLESTLEWDYDKNDKTKLIFQWNITLTNGFSGLLAFSKYDLETDHLDVMIFGNDNEMYNGYTDENSLLFLPKDSVTLTSTIINSASIDNGRKKKYTIQIIRPFDTCEKEQRNYIIDRGTTHLLTGSMKREDFQKIKQGKFIEVDVQRMNLVLQRVQLLKSQVSGE